MNGERGGRVVRSDANSNPVSFDKFAIVVPWKETNVKSAAHRHNAMFRAGFLVIDETRPTNGNARSIPDLHRIPDRSPPPPATLAPSTDLWIVDKLPFVPLFPFSVLSFSPLSPSLSLSLFLFCRFCPWHIAYAGHATIALVISPGNDEAASEKNGSRGFSSKNFSRSRCEVARGDRDRDRGFDASWMGGLGSIYGLDSILDDLSRCATAMERIVKENARRRRESAMNEPVDGRFMVVESQPRRWSTRHLARMVFT